MFIFNSENLISIIFLVSKARTVVTKYHTRGGGARVLSNRHLHFTVVKAGKAMTRISASSCSSESLLPGLQVVAFLLCHPMVVREWALVSSSPPENTNLFMEPHPHQPHPILPKTLTPKHIRLEIKASTKEFGGDTNIQYITDFWPQLLWWYTVILYC